MADTKKLNTALILTTLALLAVLVVIISKKKEPEERTPINTKKDNVPPEQLAARHKKPKIKPVRKIETAEEIVFRTLELFPEYSPTIPGKAKEMLARHKGPAVDAALVKSLGSKKPSHRRGAINLLHERGKTDLVRQALPVLLKDKDQNVKRNAIDLAAKIKATEVFALIAEIANNAPYVLRHAAVTACSVIDPVRSEKFLLEIIKTAPAPLKITAIKEATAHKFQSAVPEILKLTRTKQNPALWTEAQNAILKLAPDKEGELLANALSQESDNIKINALRRLAAMGAEGKTAIPKMVELLKVKSTAVRKAAHDSLIALTGQKLGPAPEAWQSWSKNKK